MLSIEDVFFAIAPQYASEDPARIATFIAIATEQVSFGVFGVMYNQAVAYLTAHLMTLADRMLAGGGSSHGAGGPVTSASTGGVSVSYGWNIAWGKWDADYVSTPYGVWFLTQWNKRRGTGMRLIRG